MFHDPKQPLLSLSDSEYPYILIFKAITLQFSNLTITFMLTGMSRLPVPACRFPGAGYSFPQMIQYPREGRRREMSTLGHRIGNVCIWCTGAALATLAVVSAAVLIWVSVL